MQCAKCQTTIEAPASGAAPASCPHCGAPLSAHPAAWPKPSESAARSGNISSIAIVVVLLVVGLAAVAVGSTIYAMRTIEERDRAREDFAASSSAIDQIVIATASSGKLKGSAAAEDREAILTPALNYYQEISKKYQDDEQMLPEVASAQLHAAALQAKLGSAECIDTLNGGLRSLNQMIQTGDFDAESYPGFQDSVLRITAPTEWFTIKTENAMAHRVGLFLAIQFAQGTYRDLTKKFPESVGFRDDLTALLKSSAMVLTVMNNPSRALDAWLEARDVLDTMVRAEPSNADFQARFAESLVNVARIQRNTGQRDKAITNFERAVQVRQKMAEANPDDKSLARAVANVQRDLERARTAQAPKKKAKEDAPEQAEAKAASKEVAKDEAPKEEAPKDEAEEDAPKQEASDDPSPP